MTLPAVDLGQHAKTCFLRQQPEERGLLISRAQSPAMPMNTPQCPDSAGPRRILWPKGQSETTRKNFNVKREKRDPGKSGKWPCTYESGKSLILFQDQLTFHFSGSRSFHPPSGMSLGFIYSAPQSLFQTGSSRACSLQAFCRGQGSSPLGSPICAVS